MKTNKFFNLKRFYYLIMSDLRLNKKRYLFSLAGAIAVFYMVILYDINRWTYWGGFHSQLYTNTFFTCLLALGGFVGSAFPDLSGKVKTSNYLLLPASTFEKVLSQFLIYIIFGSFFFLLIYWTDAHLAYYTIQLKESVRLGETAVEPFQFSKLLDSTTLNRNFEFAYFIMFPVALGLFLFSVRLFFNRFALIKTIIAELAVILLISTLMVLLSHLFFPETRGFNVELKEYEVYKGVPNFLLYFFIITCSSWVFLPLAYFKLKEKQG